MVKLLNFALITLDSRSNKPLGRHLTMYLPSYLSTYLLAYLSIYLPTYLLAYLPVYRHGVVLEGVLRQVRLPSGGSEAVGNPGPQPRSHQAVSGR